MAKNIILGLLLLGICNNVYGSTKATSDLADVILKSTYAMENNPALTAKCFQTYMPLINELAEKYEAAYNGCLNLTAEAEEALKQQVQEDIDTMQNVTNTMCVNFSNCNETSENLYDLFQCYYNVVSLLGKNPFHSNIFLIKNAYFKAGNNIQSSYEVQNLAKDKMSFVQIREENIYYNQTVCTDECSRVYVEESAKVHADLEACLAGKPVTTTTTSEPDVTTEKSPVETTDAPDASTEKPAVTTPDNVPTAPEVTTKKSESS